MMGERRRIVISFDGRFCVIFVEIRQPHHISPTLQPGVSFFINSDWQHNCKLDMLFSCQLFITCHSTELSVRSIVTMHASADLPYIQTLLVIAVMSSS
jgi:hypothetical protein